MKQLKNLIACVLCISLLGSMGLIAQADSSQPTPYFDDEFITQEMVERDKEVASQMIEQGKSISRTRASKTLSVTLLYQNPIAGDVGEWKNTYMPCGHDTYGNVGCAMTCYAMTARYYKIASLNTPPKFGQSYWDQYNDPCRQASSSAAELMGKTAQVVGASSQDDAIYFCIASINANKPVVVRTNKGNTHYVLAYGYSGNTIYIRDPERGYRRTTLQQYFADSSVIGMASIG